MSFKLTIFDEKLSTQVDAFESLNDFEVKSKLLAQVVRSELMNFRSGNAHTKTRAEVSGGGKKPWKQKGTGRARHGSTRSPIWVGGGVNFGPRNTVNWSLKINKSSRTSALKSIVKDRLVNNSIYIFQENFEFLKTKSAMESINHLSISKNVKNKKIAIIYSNEDKDSLRGFGVTEVKMINVQNIKIVNLVNTQSYIFTPKAKDLLESRFSS